MTVYNQKKAQYQTPTWGQTDKSPRWNSVLIGWEISPIYEAERNRFLEDLAPLTYRLLDIKKNRHAAKEANLDAKIQLKEAADIAMGDASTKGSAEADRLVTKVSDALSRKYGLTEKVKGPLIFDWWFSDANSFCPDYNAISEVAAGSVEEEGHWEENHSENWRHQEAITIASAQDKDFLNEQRRHCAQVKEEVDWSAVWYDKPSTYSDILLTIVTPFAVKYLLGHVPPHQLRSVRFRSSVFTGSNIFIPSHLSIHISASLKFMMYKKPQPELLSSAYANFE